jgi:hypothetical protein
LPSAWGFDGKLVCWSSSWCWAAELVVWTMAWAKRLKIDLNHTFLHTFLNV